MKQDKQSSLNFTQIKGRIVSDPEMKIVGDGKKLLSFRMVFMTPQRTDASGSHSNFITVQIWGKMAEAFQPLLTRNLLVIAKGSLVQNRWKGEDGKDRSMFRLSADSLAISDPQYLPKDMPVAS